MKNIAQLLSVLSVGLLSGIAPLNAAESALEQTKTLSPPVDALLATYFADVEPIMANYCFGCHGEDKQKADLRFDEVDPAMALDQDVAVWQSVLDVLILHDMPPLEEDHQPSDTERQVIVDWIHTSFERVTEQRRANRSSPMRRLTVSEYENTLKELFGTDVSFGSDLPAAPLSEHGFSRDAALLGVSALELEYFLNIARKAVDDFVIFRAPIPAREHLLIEFEDVKYRPGVAGGYTVDEPLSEDDLMEKLKAREAGEVVYSDRSLFPFPDGPLDKSTEELNRGDRQKFQEQFVRFKSLHLHDAGELIAKVHVASKLGDDGSAPRLRFGVTGRSGFEFGDPIEHDVTASIDDPEVITFRIPFRYVATVPRPEEKDVRLTLRMTNVSRDPEAIYDVVPEGYNFSEKNTGLIARHRRVLANSIDQKETMRAAGVNELYLDAVEIEIVPFGMDVYADLWRIDAQRMNLNAGADSRKVAEDSLQRFMQKAYRRSISPSELDAMLALYDQFEAEGDHYEEALRETFATVLISDPFLYLAAPIPVEDHPFISDQERSQFAARLSYFLWGGPPDDRLLELAAQNRLSDPATLANEVSRMLEDDRSRRFSERFAREWLRLDKYGLVAVNPEYYPEYDDDLGADMVQEVIATFQAIFHGDGDARDLISSDTVYVNQRLARHYGMPPVTGGKFQAVNVPDYRTRGGLLHQGAILTMTADGQESNPIYRGVWILERILHDPPPPPPPAVPALEASASEFAGLTLKQKIELHRAQNSCTSCHAKIDPWGIALENFDAIGAWREESLVINPDTAAQSFLPVDSSTVLPSGVEIEDSADLSTFLGSEREYEFTRSIVWHMMTYALAREPNIGDQAELDSIHRHFRTSGYKLSALVLAITQSEVFQVAPESPMLEQLAGAPIANAMNTNID